MWQNNMGSSSGGRVEDRLLRRPPADSTVCMIGQAARAIDWFVTQQPAVTACTMYHRHCLSTMRTFDYVVCSLLRLQPVAAARLNEMPAYRQAYVARNCRAKLWYWWCLAYDWYVQYWWVVWIARLAFIRGRGH